MVVVRVVAGVLVRPPVVTMVGREPCVRSPPWTTMGRLSRLRSAWRRTGERGVSVAWRTGRPVTPGNSSPVRALSMRTFLVRAAAMRPEPEPWPGTAPLVARGSSTVALPTPLLITTSVSEQ